MNEIAPALVLLTGALLVLGGAKLTRRLGLPEAFGCGLAICIIAIGIGLSPAGWRAWWAGGSWGDRLLTSVRIVGLTGMLFLAGTRFNPGQLRRKAGLIFGFSVSAGALFAVAVLLLKLLGWLDSGSIVLVAAAIVGSSLWLPGELSNLLGSRSSLRDRGVLGDSAVNLPLQQLTAETQSPRRSRREPLVIDWQAGAVVFTAVALLAVYFYDIFAVVVHARSVSASAYIILAMYETVKLFVFFGFACFVSSRFLARAEGRISASRTTIGFVLIAVLIFALAAITTSQLGAIAWSFSAGTLWRRSEMGKKFSDSERRVGSAALISFAFLPLMLQSHGRSLTGFLALIIAVLAAMLLKWVFVWIGMRAGGTSSGNAMRNAAAMVGPGEVGILLLGFGMTRWAIAPPGYFGIVGYALASSVFIPLLWRWASKPVAPIYQSRCEELETNVC